MRKVEPPQGKWHSVVFFLTAFLVVAADQLSKTWIRDNLAKGESLPETGFCRLTHVHNTGVAFGLFQGHSFLFTIIAVVGIVLLLIFVLFFYRRLHFPDSWLADTALGLILGGTIGNLIDRLRLGYVTDFIDFGIWPAFNIADSAIVVGVIIFAYFLLSVARTKETDSST